MCTKLVTKFLTLFQGNLPSSLSPCIPEAFRLVLSRLRRDGGAFHTDDADFSLRCSSGHSGIIALSSTARRVPVIKMLARKRISHCAALLLAVCTLAYGGQAPKNSAQQPSKPSSPPLSAQEIFKLVSPSVMVVESLNVKGTVTAFGSGVVVAPERVVTNRHVIEDGASFRVEHGEKTWPAKLIRVDPDHDLAELSVGGLTAPTVSVRDSSTLAVGEKVYAIGAPEGLELTISEGLISGLRDFDKDRVIQTSAAISPGSSGGGLFDDEGRLVGITTFYLKEGQSLNFALPGEWTLVLDRQPTTAAPSARETSPAFQALVWFEMGYIADQGGKYEQAITAYQEAIRLKPDLAGAWVNLGGAYNLLGQYGKAVNAAQEAIRLKPDSVAAWYNLGGVFKAKRQQSEVIEVYKKLKSLDPKLADTFFQEVVMP